MNPSFATLTGFNPFDSDSGTVGWVDAGNPKTSGLLLSATLAIVAVVATIAPSIVLILDREIDD